MGIETTAVFPKAELLIGGTFGRLLRGHILPGCEIIAQKKSYSVIGVKHVGTGEGGSFTPRQTKIKLVEDDKNPKDDKALVKADINLSETGMTDRFFFVDMAGAIIAVPNRVSMVNEFSGIPAPGDVLEWGSQEKTIVFDIKRFVLFCTASETRLSPNRAVFFLDERKPPQKSSQVTDCSKTKNKE